MPSFDLKTNVKQKIQAFSIGKLTDNGLALFKIPGYITDRQAKLEELKSAPTLSELRNIPSAYCHELKKNRKGQFAVSVSGNHRIIFEPDHHPVPVKEDGGWDWTGITAIRIVEIGEDYH